MNKTQLVRVNEIGYLPGDNVSRVPGDFGFFADNADRDSLVAMLALGWDGQRGTLGGNDQRVDETYIASVLAYRQQVWDSLKAATMATVIKLPSGAKITLLAEQILAHWEALYVKGGKLNEKITLRGLSGFRRSSVVHLANAVQYVVKATTSPEQDDLGWLKAESILTVPVTVYSLADASEQMAITARENLAANIGRRGLSDRDIWCLAKSMLAAGFPAGRLRSHDLLGPSNGQKVPYLIKAERLYPEIGIEAGIMSGDLKLASYNHGKVKEALDAGGEAMAKYILAPRDAVKAAAIDRKALESVIEYNDNKLLVAIAKAIRDNKLTEIVPKLVPVGADMNAIADKLGL